MCLFIDLNSEVDSYGYHKQAKTIIVIMRQVIKRNEVRIIHTLYPIIS